MNNRQALQNIKRAKCVPYKHETITQLVQMAKKLDEIEQIVNAEVDPNICHNVGDVRKIKQIREV